jgi:microsomal dipeptidase-like Zn-dependent dipeptidase
MHLEADSDSNPTLEEMLRAWRTRHPRPLLRGLLMDVASRVANYRSWSSGRRVDIPKMRDGDVRLGFSVLLDPEAEFEPDHWGDPPQADYVERVIRLLQEVEAVVSDDEDGACVAHNREELDRGLDAGQVVLVHCIEGGFHLGADDDQIAATVEKLANCGVVYVTLAHLFWRGVASDANAFPFLSDRLYDRVFGDHPGGLTELGKTAVREMAKNRVLIDVSHMDDRAIDATFDLLDTEVDPEKKVPVVATHAGTRQGEKPMAYNVSRKTVERIAERDGVVGMIMGDHIMTDGIWPDRQDEGRRSKSFDESIDVLCRHIDQVNEWSGRPFRHVGIGTDLDGFIKPTLAEIETAWDMKRVELALARRYKPDEVELICSGNALRLLRDYVWSEPKGPCEIEPA